MYAWLMKHLFLPLYDAHLMGRKTLLRVREVDCNQWLSREELEELQWTKLQRLLRYAYEKVPYYRKRLDEIGLHPEDIRTPRDFLHWPILEKQDIRENFEALQSPDYRHLNTIKSATGGSTGEPVHFVYPREAWEWRIAATARTDRWAGWDFGCKEAHLWGVSWDPERLGPRLKKKVHDFLLRRRIYNSWSLTEEVLSRYVQGLNRFKPDVLMGYTNPLFVMARFVEERDLPVPRMRGIVATAEMLYDYQRETIEKVFQAPVFNRYGCRELMLIASECEYHQGMHLNSDNQYHEFLRDNEPVEAGEVGEIVITDLNNYGMPFIRYRNGDLGIPGNRTCPCGRGLPLMEGMQGRLLDMIVTPDGRYVAGEYFIRLLKTFPGIRHFQVVQEAVERLEIRLVTDSQFRPEYLEETRRSLGQIVGARTRIEFQMVDAIPLTASGKWRVTVSRIPVHFRST